MMLYTFSADDPVVKSRLLQAYCLSLYMCALWNLSCSSIYSIEVSFNNILKKVWRLPRNCHIRILHPTARLPSLFNVIISRSSSLLLSALSCPSPVARKVFQDIGVLAYTQTGYNAMFADHHAKVYFPEDGQCASVIRHLRIFGPVHMDSEIDSMINTICTR